MQFLQLVISGISQGCIYGLIALGFVLIYKATETVSFAQGELMMLGAFCGLGVMTFLEYPFWVAVLVPLFVRSERLRPVQWLGLGCAFVAVVFALREALGMGGSATGDLLGLAAGALWGLTTVSIRATGLTRISPEKLLFYQIATTAVAVPWISLALGEHWTFEGWSPLAWGSMLAQTVVGAFASYLAWMWMLGRYPATRISVFVFLTPLFALLFGTLLLGEPVTTTLLVALGLVAVGIVLVNRKPG